MIKKIINEITPPLIKRLYKSLTKHHYHPEWIILKGRLEGISFYIDPNTLLGKALIKGHDDFFYPIIEEIIDKKQELIIYDIGAHFGYHSLGFAKAIGAKGKVYAFEPHPFNIERLKLNINRNPDLVSRIIVFEVGISENEDVVLFKMYKNIEEGTSSASSIIENKITPRPVNDLFKEIQINTTTLDNLIMRKIIKPPDIIKIDIEGAEYRALVGALNTIREFRPEFLIEIHSIKNMFLINAFLQDFQYELKIISEESDGRCFILANPK